MENSAMGSPSHRPALPFSFLSCPKGGGCLPGRSSRAVKGAPPPPLGVGPTHVQPIVWILLWVVVAAGFVVGYDSSTYQVYDPAFQALFLPEIERSPNSEQELAARYWRLGHSLKGGVAASVGVYLTGGASEADYAGGGFVTSGGSVTPWCTYTSPKAQGMTASKYLAFAVGALLAAWTTRRFGRRKTMWMACLVFAVAQVVQATAMHLGQVMLGRILSGLANGVLMQVPYIEAAEISTTRRRGAFVCAVGVGRALGMSCRALLMKGLAGSSLAQWAWRITALFGVWPALSLLLLLPFFEDTPSGLVQRGRLEEGRRMLQALRGPYQDVTAEYNQILAAATLSIRSRTQWHLLLQRSQRPQLIVTCTITLLKCFTMSNASSLFSMVVDEPSDVDANSNIGLVINTIVTCVCWMLGSVIAMLLADRAGRRPLLIVSAVADGVFSLVVMLLIIFQADEQGRFSVPTAYGIAIMLGAAELATSFGEGPVGWLVVVESFGLPTRALAMSINVVVKGLADTTTSLMGAPMLCATRWGLFCLYTCVALVLALFAAIFLPETKKVPLEEVALAYQGHWLWRRYNPADALKPAVSLGRQQSAHVPLPPAAAPASPGRRSLAGSIAGSFTSGGGAGGSGSDSGGGGGGGGGVTRGRTGSHSLFEQHSLPRHGLSQRHVGGDARRRQSLDLSRRLRQALGLDRMLTLDRGASHQLTGADAEMHAALREAT